MKSRQELIALVRALPLPDERREVVLLELEDHVFEEMAELESRGHSREDAERLAVAALGPGAVFGKALAGVNRAFSFGWWDATRAGVKLGAWFGGAIWLSWLVFSQAERSGWPFPDEDWSGPLTPVLRLAPLVFVVAGPALAFLAGLPDHAFQRFRSRNPVEPFRGGFLTGIRTATIAERWKNLRLLWGRRHDFSWVAMLIVAQLVAWIPFKWETALSAFTYEAFGITARPDPVIAQLGLMAWVWLSVAITGWVVVARILQRRPSSQDPERIA